MNFVKTKSDASVNKITAEIAERRRDMEEKRKQRATEVENILNWTPNIANQGNNWETSEGNNLEKKEVLNSKYSRIWECIFYWDNVEVLYADAKSFQTPFQNEKYACDAHHVYISGMIIPGADPSTFQFLQIDGKDSVYTTDKTGKIYIEDIIIPFDKNTFQVIWERYAFDKNWVYRIDRKLSWEQLEKTRKRFQIPVSGTTAILNAVTAILNKKII